MPAVNIHVNHAEIRELNLLFEIQRDFFPGQNLIQPGVLGYDMELDDARAKYLLDMLAIIPDMKGFEPFVEWQGHQEDQMPLEFPTPSIEKRTSVAPIRTITRFPLPPGGVTFDDTGVFPKVG